MRHVLLILFILFVGCQLEHDVGKIDMTPGDHTKVEVEKPKEIENPKEKSTKWEEGKLPYPGLASSDELPPPSSFPKEPNMEFTASIISSNNTPIEMNMININKFDLYNMKLILNGHFVFERKEFIIGAKQKLRLVEFVRKDDPSKHYNVNENRPTSFVVYAKGKNGKLYYYSGWWDWNEK